MASNKDQKQDEAVKSAPSKLSDEQKELLKGGEVVREEKVKVNGDDVEVSVVDLSETSNETVTLAFTHRALTEYEAADGTIYRAGDVVDKDFYNQNLKGVLDRNNRPIFNDEEVK